LITVDPGATAATLDCSTAGKLSAEDGETERLSPSTTIVNGSGRAAELPVGAEGDAHDASSVAASNKQSPARVRLVMFMAQCSARSVVQVSLARPKRKTLQL
jgi:hypothetical protein